MKMIPREDYELTMAVAPVDSEANDIQIASTARMISLCKSCEAVGSIPMFSKTIKRSEPSVVVNLPALNNRLVVGMHDDRKPYRADKVSRTTRRYRTSSRCCGRRHFSTRVGAVVHPMAFMTAVLAPRRAMVVITSASEMPAARGRGLFQICRRT